MLFGEPLRGCAAVDVRARSPSFPRDVRSPVPNVLPAHHDHPSIGLDPRWRRIALWLIVVAAIAVRLDGIEAGGHLVEREYNSAIFARAFYFENNEEIEPWRQRNAQATRDLYPLLEPPVTEYLLAAAYRLTGREEIWFGRLITSAFWLVGGFFLYGLARRTVGADAAVIATGIYLLGHWAILVSRSVQPDALMMMMFLMSLHAIVRHFDAPRRSGLVLVAALVGLTVLLRPLAGFAIAGAYLALALRSRGRWSRGFVEDVLIFATLSAMPSVLYYGHGILVGGDLRGQAAMSFRPHLLVHEEFWKRWLASAVSVVGGVTVLGAVLGYASRAGAVARKWVVGALGGYVVFALCFTYHTITHPYYHIQLLPLLAIGAGLFWVRVVRLLREKLGRACWVPIVAMLVLFFHLGLRELQAELGRPKNIESLELAREIGERIGHSDRVVMVARHYGLPLEYHGEFAGKAWPVPLDDAFYRAPGARALSVEERLGAMGFLPEYFVITDLERYARVHADLAEYLAARYELVAKRPDLEIHRYRRPIREQARS